MFSGEDHRRHRKILAPAFGAPEAKALFAVHLRGAEAVRCCVPRSWKVSSLQPTVLQLAAKWRDMLSAMGEQSAVLNAAAFISRATLDVIGEGIFPLSFYRAVRSSLAASAGFDFHFGALDDEENELGRAYRNMMSVNGFSGTLANADSP